MCLLVSPVTQATLWFCSLISCSLTPILTGYYSVKSTLQVVCVLIVVILVILFVDHAGTPANIDITFQNGPSETVSLGPDNPQSSVRLSCTVTVSGLFQWTWLHNGNTVLSSDRYQILTGDATRSSILVINKLSYTDEGTYSCNVSQPHSVINSQNFTLRLLGML